MNQPLQVRWDGTIKNSGVPKCIKANEKHFIHLRKMKEKKNLKKKKRKIMVKCSIYGVPS
jgi:hypothetical protein